MTGRARTGPPTGRLAGGLLCALLAGCTTVRPPDPAPLRDPCRVYLLRSALHVALALPDERGGLTRWGYGDRRYMSDWSWTQYPWGLWLLLVGLPMQPTDGVMERIELRRSTAEGIAFESRMEVFEFEVERASAVALHARLASKCGTPLPDCPWLFETDDGYSTWWDNCQTAVAGWSREIGCGISPWRIVPRWGRWSVAGREPVLPPAPAAQ